MAIIKQFDKRSGNTYVYENISWWDKEKQCSRAKRKLIGKIDKQTDEIVPTNGRQRNAKQKPAGTSPAKLTVRKFGGAVYLLNSICSKIGLIDDLKTCFGEVYKLILSIAFFMIIEGESAILRFSKFDATHFHPCGYNITSQAGSELFASIKDCAVQDFFMLQSKRRQNDEYWVYDTTSISSYSEMLNQVQYGHNKEDDNLPQLNLGLVFGEKSNLPFYYRKLSGNITDVSTFETLCENMADIGITNVNFVADRGFYSERNIDMLYNHSHKFLLAAKLNTKYIRNELEEIYDDFNNFESYSEEFELYGKTRIYTRKNGKPIYLHYFYNIEKAAEEEKRLNKRIALYKRELLSNRRVIGHEAYYKKFFNIETDDNKLVVSASVKLGILKTTKRYYGFFVLTASDLTDCWEALKIYRNKDVVEKAFANVKERLNMRRTLVSSEQSLDGKLFVSFVSLILLSHIKKVMQDFSLFKSYTLKSLMDTFDIIECFKNKNNEFRLGEVLDKQKNLFALFDVVAYSSLCIAGM